MTEHSKIPLPGEPEGSGESDSNSLFERASGAFGFDPFKPKPVPGKLAEPPITRARVPEKAPVEPEPETAAPASEMPAKSVRTPAPEPEPTMPVPVPARPSEVTVEADVGAIVLKGKRYPINRGHLRDQGMIVPEGSVTALIEEFRIVKRRILSAAMERGTAKSRRVLICSPHPGEGKTFCATNLAIAMAAERDSEVLLVDADFAKPSILSTLGLPKGPGLMDCLADPSIAPEDLVMGTDIPGLWVLPAGNHTAVDSEYLASSRTAEVLDRLTMGAPNRMVIFDSPPALAASPAAELAKHVGQAVLVARADKSSQNSLEDACQLLSACPDIKLLLNATSFSPSGRNFGSYYGYGG